METRQQLLDAIHAGQPFRQVLRDLGLTSNQVWGLTKTDQEWSEKLDTALTAARRDDLEHGTNAAYVQGCVCSECREHQRRQLLYSAVHGTAMRYAAEKRDLAESIAELHQIADGRDYVLAEAADITAGSWYAWPSTHVGYELVAAGMLIMASGHDGKPMDYDELERWTRTGFERGMRFRKGER